MQIKIFYNLREKQRGLYLHPESSSKLRITFEFWILVGTILCQYSPILFPFHKSYFYVNIYMYIDIMYKNNIKSQDIIFYYILKK